MKLPFFLILISLTAPLSAAVYKTVLPDGSVVYSDRPPTVDAKPAELPPIQFIPAPPPPAVAATPSPPAKSEKRNYYQSLEITQPTADGTVRDNAGTVNVAISVMPALLLEAGHTIAVYLDGKLVADDAGAGLVLQNVDRGTHTLSASVVSKQGQSLISSPSVTFHMHRTSSRN